MDLASYIDHTLLKPAATSSDIEQLCREAVNLGCFSVCVNGCWVALAKSLLRDTKVKVCSVIGFPLGAMSSSAKTFEASQSLRAGADEIDMVINVGWLKEGKRSLVIDDIRGVQAEITQHGALLKVIIETALLTDLEKETASELVCEAGAAFVKTCTGFSGGQATIEDVTLIKTVVGNRAQIKASGGIKDRGGAVALIEAGASRLGTSSAKAILSGQSAEGSY